MKGTDWTFSSLLRILLVKKTHTHTHTRTCIYIYIHTVRFQSLLLIPSHVSKFYFMVCGHGQPEDSLLLKGLWVML